MNGPSAQRPLERLDGADEARVARIEETDLGHQQHAGVEVLAAEALDEGLALLAPGRLEDARAHMIGTLAPVRGALG